MKTVSDVPEEHENSHAEGAGAQDDHLPTTMKTVSDVPEGDAPVTVPLGESVPVTGAPQVPWFPARPPNVGCNNYWQQWSCFPWFGTPFNIDWNFSFYKRKTIF